MKAKTRGSAKVVLDRWTDPGGREPNGAGSPALPREYYELDGCLEVEVDVSDALEDALADVDGEHLIRDRLRWHIAEFDGEKVTFKLESDSDEN
jgi:hypothetical protein